VYLRVGATVSYLFYLPVSGFWLIGPSYSSSASGVRSNGASTALCPDQVTSWLAADGSVWSSTYRISVVSQTFPPTSAATTAPTALGGTCRPLP
jgi:hypothetical protein